LRPLFTVGVHDIPFLVDDAKPAQPGDQAAGREPGSGTGWIACTTDSILAMKDTLWDMLITMPPPHASNAKEHAWPTVEYPRGTPIKATQRDLRRYKALKLGLSRMQSHSNTAVESPSSPETPRILTSPQKQTQDDPLLDEAEKIVEPLSWAALAYNGFMWWASAGEQARSDQAEESAYDASLLADVLSPSISMHKPHSSDLSSSITSINRRASNPAQLPSDEARVELAIIAYFHRLTTQILTNVTDIVDNYSDYDDAGSNTEEDDGLLEPGEEVEFDGHGIRIRSEALRAMGLDRWSTSDVEFVKEVVTTYFGRSAYVDGKGVEVCGVRVC
jgi:hypothetical protein